MAKTTRNTFYRLEFQGHHFQVFYLSSSPDSDLHFLDYLFYIIQFGFRIHCAARHITIQVGLIGAGNEKLEKKKLANQFFFSVKVSYSCTPVCAQTRVSNVPHYKWNNPWRIPIRARTRRMTWTYCTNSRLVPMDVFRTTGYRYCRHIFRFYQAEEHADETR